VSALKIWNDCDDGIYVLIQVIIGIQNGPESFGMFYP